MLAAAAGSQATVPAATSTPTGLYAAATNATPMGLLTAATLAIPSPLVAGDLPTLAAMSRVGNVPGPRLAGLAPVGVPLADLPAVQAVTAVQRPLLAAGQDAASGGGFRLASVGGVALPGLLVIIGTAIVAAVGAGNLRACQARLLARRG